MTVLNSEQQRAAKAIRRWYLYENKKMFVLSGYAGSGKTFLIRHIVCDILGLIPGNSVEFVTPTGKAATVLIKNGTNTSTIHHLIYKPYEDYEEVRVNGRTEIVKKLKFREKGQHRLANKAHCPRRGIHGLRPADTGSVGVRSQNPRMRRRNAASAD